MSGGIQGGGVSMERPVTFFPLLFKICFLAGRAEMRMLVKGKLFPGRFFFPKNQGQEESTPRVVGGKKNNKAQERLGSTALLTSSVIISAWLGCLSNLHNTILTLHFSYPSHGHAARMRTLPPPALPSQLTLSHVYASIPPSCLCAYFYGAEQEGEKKQKMDFTSCLS